MIDDEGYRPNVGIILCNDEDRVFWARRCGQSGWQFPQGGIKPNETPEQALYRELCEEVGLKPDQVRILGRTRDWLHYELPESLRRSRNGSFRDQKQIWFLLHFMGEDCDVQLTISERPEFDAWRWIEYWTALEHIIEFKREVYRQAMTEPATLLSTSSSRASSTPSSRSTRSTSSRATGACEPPPGVPSRSSSNAASSNRASPGCGGRYA